MIRFVCCLIGLTICLLFMAVCGPVGKSGVWFCVVYGLGFLFLLGTVNLFPRHLSRNHAIRIIFCYCITLRIVFIGFPASFDVNRYVWEGAIQSYGYNPYGRAPLDPELNDLAQGSLEPIWRHINHKDMAACYPPLALLLFRVLAAMIPNPVFFKLVFIAVDCALLWLLMRLLDRQSYPIQRLLWYGANPLILVFIAGEGHFDVIMAFLLCLGTARVLDGKPITGFFCIGCGMMVKYFAIIAVPFLLRKQNWKHAFSVLLPMLSYVPFMDGGVSVFQSLVSFGMDFHYNDAITAVIRSVAGDDAHLIAGGILVMGCGLIFILVQNPMRELFLAMTLTLLCLPTLHPWYLVWVAPFAALFASAAVIGLQAAMVFIFPVLIIEYDTGVFQEIHWLKIPEYLLFIALVIWGSIRKTGYTGRHFRPVQTLGIVIPTLNESHHLANCLASLKGQESICHIVVADGGSSDATRNIAGDFGVTIVDSPRGRGIQIDRGIRSIRDKVDVWMIVHADCQVNPGAIDRVLHQLNTIPQMAGGSLAMAFADPDGKKRFIALLNNLRAWLTGISFGDQGQFFRSEALDLMGGFPQIMLMEDVEVSLRMKTVGGVGFVTNGMTVSGRRWTGRPFFRNIAMVCRLFMTFLIRRRLGLLVPDQDKSYYLRYYANQ